MSTIMMHWYQNTLLKWFMIGNDLGQWQLHIIYNFLADLHKSEVIFIDLYQVISWWSVLFLCTVAATESKFIAMMFFFFILGLKIWIKMRKERLKKFSEKKSEWYYERKVWRYQREIIRIRKLKKDKQHNGQKKKDKRTNNAINLTLPHLSVCPN
jgi:hypothetical protein